MPSTGQDVARQAGVLDQEEVRWVVSIGREEEVREVLQMSHYILLVGFGDTVLQDSLESHGCQE